MLESLRSAFGETSSAVFARDGGVTSVVAVVAIVVVAIVVAVAVHLLGQAAAGKALGGTALGLVHAWPALRLTGTLPRGAGRELEAAFVLSGSMANLGAAGALFSTPSGLCHVAGAVQLAWVVLSLLPIGGSDGARLLALRRRSPVPDGPGR